MYRLLPALLLASTALGQTALLHSTPGHPAVQQSAQSPEKALTQTRATLTFRLTEAEGKQRGELYLRLHATAASPGHPDVTLRIPLSSNQDAYGESRTCSATTAIPSGPVYTAGLDEKNFAPFEVAGKDTAIDLSANKYLCRALAVPFHCGGHLVTLPKNWALWHFDSASLELSADAPATVEATPVSVKSTGQPFAPTSCAVVAPSAGICCVAHRTTQWHCGTRPTGHGWHKVSGDCWHRETGTTCPD